MVRTRSWQTFLGATALLATLALTSPGVQLARAGDDDSPAPAAASSQTPAAEAPDAEPSSASVPAEGSVCRATTAEEAGTRSDAAVVRLQEYVAAQAAALAAAAGEESSETEGMALNNRGYSYGNPPAP